MKQGNESFRYPKRPETYGSTLLGFHSIILLWKEKSESLIRVLQIETK